MRYKTDIFIASIMAMACSTAAAEFHPLVEIRKSAEVFAKEQVATPNPSSTIEVGYLDPRLRLPLCGQPLSAERLGQQRGNPNMTVTIKCGGEKPWSVHVPVKISLFATISIVSRPLPRGATIQPSDLRYEKREISQLRNGYFENSEDLVGRVLKRSLMKEAAISPGDLEQNRIIKRGSSVTIIAHNNNITVKMPGRALDDAVEGALVKVENSSSKRIVEAVALRPGVVEVQM